MRTTLSSSFAVCLSLAFFGCAGNDDAQKPAASSTPAPAPETALAPIAPAVPAPPPSDDAASDAADSTVAATPADPAETTPTPELMAPPSAVAQPQELDWRPCGQFEDHDLECAELEVPIDYAQPDGEKLELAIRRIQADPNEPYRGALLFNPGGPGGEGIDLTLEIYQGGLFNQIAPGFDIIGFDPRGVAASGERGCGILPPAMYPDTSTPPADLKGLVDVYLEQQHARGEQCQKAWGALFDQMGSNNVVRDIEEIRKALRQPVLNFYGASYGTRLGSLYAHAYPETTGRIVLDGAVNPRANFVDLVRGQFYQAITLHEQLFLDCESGARTCPPNARKVFDQVLANADQRGLRDNLVGLWQEDLASPGGVQLNLQMLAAEAANPGSDWITPLFSGPPTGSGISEVPLKVVNCIDDTVEPPTEDQFIGLLQEFAQASPLFANTAIATANCTSWPITRDPVPLPTAIEAKPLLVIGGTHDLRTPYPWSQAMTETLGNATLLTSNHYGHVALANGSDCVRRIIRAYLTSGSLPATGATCP